MSDEYLMSTADAAIAAEASKRVQAVIEAVWECVDGPPTAYATWRRKQGDDVHCLYRRWCFIPDAKQTFGSRNLEMLIEWFPDGIQQDVEHQNTLVDDITQKIAPITPETHCIVWRTRPEFDKRGERWYLYARFEFMPKDAWFLEENST